MFIQCRIEDLLYTSDGVDAVCVLPLNNYKEKLANLILSFSLWPWPGIIQSFGICVTLYEHRF